MSFHRQIEKVIVQISNKLGVSLSVIQIMCTTICWRLPHVYIILSSLCTEIDIPTLKCLGTQISIVFLTESTVQLLLLPADPRVYLAAYKLNENGKLLTF